MTAFTLQPFAPPHPAVEITGSLEREGNQIAIAFTLAGNLNEVIIPPTTPPARKYDLWEATCFEFFLGQPTLAPYWEFNLSPSGDWNVFHLEAYRQGLQEEAAIQKLPFQVQQDATSLTLSLTLDLDGIMGGIPAFDIGICAVIQSHTFPLSYWALAHKGPQADFHRRDSFILSV